MKTLQSVKNCHCRLQLTETQCNHKRVFLLKVMWLAFLIFVISPVSISWQVVQFLHCVTPKRPVLVFTKLGWWNLDGNGSRHDLTSLPKFSIFAQNYILYFCSTNLSLSFDFQNRHEFIPKMFTSNANCFKNAENCVNDKFSGIFGR